MSAGATVKAAKAALRKEVRARVKAIPEEEKAAQSAAVFRKLVEHPSYVRAKRISLYLHMDDEVRTLDVLKHALEAGKKCYIPRYFVGGIPPRMEMLRLRDYEDYLSLPETAWKIKQPADDDTGRTEAMEDGLDLVLMPGMAFTSQGHRLGRGKGYYDTYLRKARQGQGGLETVALAFRQQLVQALPTDTHDEPVDHVITPD